MGNDVGVVDQPRQRSVTWSCRPNSVGPRLSCTWTAPRFRAGAGRLTMRMPTHAQLLACRCPRCRRGGSLAAVASQRIDTQSQGAMPAMDSGGPHACPTCMHRMCMCMYAPHACTGRMHRMHTMDSVTRSSPWQCLSACHPGTHGRTRGRPACRLRTATSPIPCMERLSDRHPRGTYRCHTRHFHVHVHMEMCGSASVIDTHVFWSHVCGRGQRGKESPRCIGSASA